MSARVAGVRVRGFGGVLCGWFVACVVCVVGLGVFCGVAGAAVAAPGWESFGFFAPTDLVPGGSGKLVLFVYDVGAEPSSGAVTVTDRLPDGLVLPGGSVSTEGNLCVGSSVVVCEVGGMVPLVPAGRPVKLEIPVSVPLERSGGTVDEVEVSGGGAASVAKATVPAVFGGGSPGAGLANVDGWATSVEGVADTQAGSHPYDLTVAMAFNNEVVNSAHEVIPAGGEARTIDVKLPPGLVGNPTAVPRCSRQLFDDGEIALENGKGCPASSDIGSVEVGAKGVNEAAFPVFNITPPPGVAALFGFDITGGIPVLLEARVRSGGNYGITEHVQNAPQRQPIYTSVTIWGVPSEASHGSERRGASEGPGASTTPFLTLPTSCVESQEFDVEEINTWQEEDMVPAGRPFFTHDTAGQPLGFTGCESLVHFEPTMSIAPDTIAADSPAGLSAELRVPQGVNPEGLATSGLRDTTVTLPVGMAINPGEATGLTACLPGQGPGHDDLPASRSEGESEAWDGPPECSSSSKVGTVQITTPLLPDTLEGSVYVLQSDPPDVKILLAASGDGVNVKLIGDVHENETTGRLTTTFDETPDTPITEFKLSFSGGAQAALITPPTCGVYTTSSLLEPWSGLQSALVEGQFGIDVGPEGAPCANPLPFHPSFTAGSTTDQAGGYTSFSMLLQRSDGQQRIGRLEFQAPKGLLGMITAVPLCREPQAAAGTCPAVSQIGNTVIGSGAGPYPLFIPQAGQPPAPIYLTEGYGGAPYGLSIVVPVIAGPFNLGVEVVRAQIEVDPHTAQVTVATNTLPQIIKGIPTDLRSIYAVIDRPGFMFNPTDCSPMSITGAATSTEGATAPLGSHFQVGSCQVLKFKPNFKVSTSGKTSRAGGASLNVKIVYPTTPLGDNQATSQANIARARVELPKRLPSRLTTLQKACRAAVFEANPASCPATSVVGHATAVTPVLPLALTGPAYFVSHGGEAFPSLVVVLQGNGVTVDLVGTTVISSKGITSNTFKEVPDVPVTSFELMLPQGPYSALAANGNLCKGQLLMPTEFVGQNGSAIHQSTKISVTGCPKAKKQAKAKKKRKRG
jgi:hypothetical protein